MRFLIAGQGLAGTTVAWRLLELGQDVLVVDPCEESTSSTVAAGLMTPITGKDLSPSWTFSPLLKQAIEFYEKYETKLGAKFFYPTAITRIFISESEKELYTQSLQHDEFNQHVEATNSFPNYLKAPFGGFSMPLGGRVNVKEFVRRSRAHFKSIDKFKKGRFDIDCVIPKINQWEYRGELFDGIILCRGFQEGDSISNKSLMFEPNRGQMLRIKTDQFNEAPVWNQRGLWVVREPESSFVLIGATYNRMQTSSYPSVDSFAQILKRLRRYINLPSGSFEIINHPTGIRPIIRGWKLVVGSHPRIKNVHLFNGLGSKGALRAPTYSLQLANQIVSGKSIDTDVDYGLREQSHPN